MSAIKALNLVFFCFIFFVAESPCRALSRNKRFLIFPRQAPTRHQFIGGIGIPVDLEYESLVVGHVLKAQFFLPYNATVFRENPYLPEYKVNDDKLYLRRQIQSSALRWNIYDYIINRINDYGHNGHECVLKAICEANSINFERNSNVFAELMHIFFSPSSSMDYEMGNIQHFKEAERIGRSKDETCDFYACKISLINLISNVLQLKTSAIN